MPFRRIQGLRWRLKLLSLTVLKAKAHSLNLKTPEILLLCMATKNQEPQKIALIRATALDAGFKNAKSWNIPRELSKKHEHVIKTPEGWELTPEGLATALKLIGVDQKPTVLSSAVVGLNEHVKKIIDADTRAFLQEATSCLENKLLRAAVVLTWVGAVAVLQDYVVSKHLNDFNAEAVKRDPKWKNAKTSDQLGKMKEADFLLVLESISVIGKNVKQELETCLKLRNGCGHPNSLKIGEAKVAAHIETLIQNVFMKFC